VQALTRQPGALHLLDEDLTARLHRAFTVHPWVESVRGVEIGSARASNRAGATPLRIELAYRRPVLAVCLPSDKTPPDGSAFVETGSELGKAARLPARAVDRHGVLLPVAAVQPRLPVLTAEVTPPAGPSGSHWGDRRVVAAARTAAFLRPHWTRLRLDASEIEIVEGEIVFRRPGVRIVWGHAPGQEKDGEAPAEVKLRRLLDYQNGHDGLESLEHDVRWLAYQGHFPLSPHEPARALSLYQSSQSPMRGNRNPVSNSARSWRSCFNDSKAPPASASSR
jgi:hypothetical protein